MPVRMTDLLDGWEDGSVELPPPAGCPRSGSRRERWNKSDKPSGPAGAWRPAAGLRRPGGGVHRIGHGGLSPLGAGRAVRPLLHPGERPAERRAEGAAGSDRRHRPAPVTSNGVTSPLAAVADEHTLYLRLRLEAPEGTVLPTWGSRRITSPTMWSWSTRTPGSGSTGACRRPASSRTTPRGTTPWSWCSCSWALPGTSAGCTWGEPPGPSWRRRRFGLRHRSGTAATQGASAWGRTLPSW